METTEMVNGLGSRFRYALITRYPVPNSLCSVNKVTERCKGCRGRTKPGVLEWRPAAQIWPANLACLALGQFHNTQKHIRKWYLTTEQSVFELSLALHGPPSIKMESPVWSLISIQFYHKLAHSYSR